MAFYSSAHRILVWIFLSGLHCEFARFRLECLGARVHSHGAECSRRNYFVSADVNEHKHRHRHCVHSKGDVLTSWGGAERGWQVVCLLLVDVASWGFNTVCAFNARSFIFWVLHGVVCLFHSSLRSAFHLAPLKMLWSQAFASFQV